ncbi:MAG: hemolysin family protein [Fusobacteriaceae bacterium]
MSFLTKILLIFLLIGISAFFSMAEISLAAARKLKLNVLADDGDKRAVKVLKLQENSSDFFTITQIGLNSVSILAGIVGEGIFNEYILGYLHSSFLNFKGIEIIASFSSFLFVTSLFIEFADLIPKKIAMVNPEKVAISLVEAMNIFYICLKPFVKVFSGLSNVIFKVLRLSSVREDMVTYEDIVAIVDAGAEAGVVHKKEHHLIENIFELEERWVSSVMTPRDEIVFFSLEDDSEEEIKKKIAAYPHSKFLICKNNIDSVCGYVDSKDILPRIIMGEVIGLKRLEEIRNKNLLIIPNTLTLSDALDRFNEAREDFAIIFNEYAHVVGLVTLNDVIATLVGNVVYPAQDENIIKRDENSWLIDGLTATEDVKKVLHIERFPEEESYETIAGFMMYSLKSIPKKASKIEFENYLFEVVDVDHFKVDQLLVTKIKKIEELSKEV